MLICQRCCNDVGVESAITRYSCRLLFVLPSPIGWARAHGELDMDAVYVFYRQKQPCDSPRRKDIGYVETSVTEALDAPIEDRSEH